MQSSRSMRTAMATASRHRTHSERIVSDRQPAETRGLIEFKLTGQGQGWGPFLHHKPRNPKPHVALHPPQTPTKPTKQTNQKSKTVVTEPHVALRAPCATNATEPPQAEHIENHFSPQTQSQNPRRASMPQKRDKKNHENQKC